MEKTKEEMFVEEQIKQEKPKNIEVKKETRRVVKEEE